VFWKTRRDRSSGRTVDNNRSARGRPYLTHFRSIHCLQFHRKSMLDYRGPRWGLPCRPFHYSFQIFQSYVAPFAWCASLDIFAIHETKYDLSLCAIRDGKFRDFDRPLAAVLDCDEEKPRFFSISKPKQGHDVVPNLAQKEHGREKC